MFIRKSEYEELKREKEYAVEDRDRYKRMYDTQVHYYLKERKSEIEEQKKKVEDLQRKNEELQHKIDILYAYYDINKDPTQEERTKIRLDLRVHDLEMENLELRATVRANLIYLRNDLNRAMSNYICQVPYPYRNLNANLIYC